MSKGTSLIDVNALLNLFNPAGGDGPAYFVVDAFNSNTSGPGAGKTGLLSVTGSGDPPGVPEPSTYIGMLTGLGLLGWVARRRKSAAVS